MRGGVRDALARAGDIAVVGEAETGAGAITMARRLAPDVVLLDIGLPDLDGITVLERLTAEGKASRVVMLTCQSDERSVRLAMEAGASGYLTKDAGPAEIVDAVREARRGGTPLSPDAATRLIAVMRGRRDRSGPQLTHREREVWRALADGKSNAEIAQVLFISPHTVKFHVHNLLRKLGLRTRAEAVCAALRRGLST